MMQKGLIAKIFEATGMEACNPNWIPAAQLALGIDPDGEPMNEPWSYPSIVGMLLYLATNTCPDIAFAVSQVACFCHNPKKSHATAVKTIARYLFRTCNMGTIVKPLKQFLLNCYVDADFGGLYRRDPDDVPSSAKSHAGYIIMLSNCPLIWKSRLIPEIALSTQEAEYTALSMSMRAVLPLRALILEILGALDLPSEVAATFRCRTFEDNNGALLLATKQRITNRTKYYLIKWHWFWHWVKEAKVTVLKIATEDQCADFLTKGLPRETFERIRHLVMGW